MFITQGPVLDLIRFNYFAFRISGGQEKHLIVLGEVVFGPKLGSLNLNEAFDDLLMAFFREVDGVRSQPALEVIVALVQEAVGLVHPFLSYVGGREREALPVHRLFGARKQEMVQVSFEFVALVVVVSLEQQRGRLDLITLPVELVQRHK